MEGKLIKEGVLGYASHNTVWVSLSLGFVGDSRFYIRHKSV